MIRVVVNVDELREKVDRRLQWLEAERKSRFEQRVLRYMAFWNNIRLWFGHPPMPHEMTEKACADDPELTFYTHQYRVDHCKKLLRACNVTVSKRLCVDLDDLEGIYDVES